MSRTPLLAVLALFLVALALAPTASAQCLLANPSFEIGGTGGLVFGGWNQFGVFGSTPIATHGQVGARVTGQNTGDWEVSGYWQPLDTAPGEQWTATVCVSHSSAKPLSGQSAAIVNIEWRDAADLLISYESHVAADPSTPADQVQQFSVTSGPAPAGAVSVRLLLGVLQGPADPQPDVFYDQATFEEITPVDQWGDFPGGTTLNFSGRTWRVKGPGIYGPGPNFFCNGPTCTWVDASDRLHVTISNQGGTWSSTEVVLEEALGYGDYIFTTVGELDLLDPGVILGLFLWEYRRCYDPADGWWGPYNEVDIEISRWGNPAADVGQFVAQPYDWPGNLDRFPMTFTPGGLTSHAIRWLSDRIEFRSWAGGPDDEAPETLFHSWTYTGPHISRPEQPRVHINLWWFQNPNMYQEVILDEFTFVEECSGPHCGEIVAAEPLPQVTPTTLRAVMPNPFTARTVVRFDLETASEADLAVYDVTGRRVRSLRSGRIEAGEHETSWDGRDDAGVPVAAGVYLIRLRLPDLLETRRVTRLR